MGLSVTKIKAFTLAELLVALAITTIVISLALMVLTLFGKNIESISINYSKGSEIKLLEQQITVDFNRYPTKKIENNFIKFKNPLDSIEYEFSESIIIRNLDTIYNGALNKKIYFKGDEISTGRMDALKLFLISKKDTIPLFFSHSQDAQSKMINGD